MHGPSVTYLPTSIWRYIFDFLADWRETLAFRSLGREYNTIFKRWFWSNPYRVIAPTNGMIQLECDHCKSNIEGAARGRMVGLPWVLFQSPIYKCCTKAGCTRLVFRNYMHDVRKNGYETVLAPFIQNFCTLRFEHHDIYRGYSCNRCIQKSSEGLYKILIYSGDVEHIIPVYVGIEHLRPHMIGPIKILKF